ncbi:MAG TPA: hypothetical protein VNT60_03055 [Deinococcales bacterium]|nr:hypothetical protein [Deinococcales bacterium]
MSASTASNETTQSRHEQAEQNPFFTAETSDSESMARWMLACQDDETYTS